jgi:hypothetical protein
MEYNSGLFICPKCGTKRMNIFTNWLNRKIYINNIIERQWIFYKKTFDENNKCKCKFVCDCSYLMRERFCKIFDIMNKILSCCSDTCKCIFFFVYIPIVFPFILLYWIIYIICFIWKDICPCENCCETKLYNYTCINPNNLEFTKCIDFNRFTDYEDNNIWNHCQGINEHTLLQNGKNLFICYQCNRHENSLFEFIPNFIKKKEIIIDNSFSNASTVNNFIDNSRLNLSNNIAIILCPQNQEFHYSVICHKFEKFQSIEKKLYKEYPKLQKKKLIFLSKGNIINDKNKTLTELKLKNSDIIIFYEN